MEVAKPPNLDMSTATLAGALRGAFLKASVSASETQVSVGRKSTNNSLKQTSSEFFGGVCPFSISRKCFRTTYRET